MIDFRSHYQDDTKVYQISGLYKTHTTICEKWQAEIRLSLQQQKEAILESIDNPETVLKRNDSFSFQNGIEA